MELNPAQVEVLRQLLEAGFQFVAVERAERYLGVTRQGFIALLDPSANGLKIFGQPGYRIEDGIGMLVDRAGGKFFVWHGHSIAATPELLAAYESFRAEISRLLP